jgi:hypothetical protein
VDGFCSASPGSSSDADEATFDCPGWNGASEMKAIIGVAVLVLMAMSVSTSAQSAYAQGIHSNHPHADFKSGYDHGISDASLKCRDPIRIPCLAYVWKSPNGFINQTDDSSTDM